MGKKAPENIALEKSSQNTFNKAVNVLKNRIKRGEIKVVEDKPAKEIKKNLNRGAVLLSHIPHGFYEQQMKAFLSQFGKITRLKLYRSPKTGGSKGYAFIEFQLKEVAQIVAETMNNYLMFTRVIKAKYIPPEQITPAMFMGKTYTKTYYPALVNRNKNIKLSNRVLNEEEAKKRIKKSNSKLNKMQSALNKAGINYTIQLGGHAELSVKEKNPEPSTNDLDTAVKPKTRNVKKSVKEMKNMSPKQKVKSPKSKKAGVAAIKKKSVINKSKSADKPKKSPKRKSIVKTEDKVTAVKSLKRKSNVMESPSTKFIKKKKISELVEKPVTLRKKTAVLKTNETAASKKGNVKKAPVKSGKTEKKSPKLKKSVTEKGPVLRKNKK